MNLSWRSRLQSFGGPGLGLLTLAALGLRLFRLGFRSIWLDEAYSLKLAASTFSGIVRGAAQDIHPPLYHLLLAGWIRCFGTSEFAVRSLSALLGAALVPVAFKLAEALAGRRAAWWTAGWVAFSPYFIEISRSARMGSLLALTSGLALYFFWKYFEEGRLSQAAGFAIALLAALYTHYFGFLIFFAVHLFLFMGIGKLPKPRSWRVRWMFLQLHILVGYIPWLPSLWEHLHRGGPAWRGTGAGWMEPLHSFYSVAVGTACWSLMDKALVLTALGLAAGLVLFKLGPRLQAVFESLPPRVWGFWATLLLAPLGVVLIYSWNRINVFDNRYLSVMGLMLALAVGMGFSQIPKASAWMAVPLVLMGFSIPLANQYFVYGYYDNWREAAQRLRQSSAATDRVALYPAWNETPLDYYMRGARPLQGIPGKFDPIRGETENYFPIDPVNVDQLKLLFGPQERIWLVLVNAGDEQDLVKAWFAAHYRAGESHQLGSIWVGLWEPQ